MQDHDTYVAPETALDAFDILTRDINKDETRNDAAMDLFMQIAENVEGDAADAASDMLEAWDDGDGPKPTFERMVEVFAHVPYADVQELGQGDEYEDGLVTLWLENATEGYGRDRPSTGLYLEMKLDVPYKFRQQMDDAIMRSTGLDWDDVWELAGDPYQIEADMLDWALEGEWEWYLRDYPNLLDAYKYGRIERAYKGVWLKPHVSIGEAIEADHAMRSGHRDKVRESLATTWFDYTVGQVVAMALGLTMAPEIAYKEVDGVYVPNKLLGAEDQDDVRMALIREAIEGGGEVERVNRSSLIVTDGNGVETEI